MTLVALAVAIIASAAAGGVFWLASRNGAGIWPAFALASFTLLALWELLQDARL